MHSESPNPGGGRVADTGSEWASAVLYPCSSAAFTPAAIRSSAGSAGPYARGFASGVHTQQPVAVSDAHRRPRDLRRELLIQQIDRLDMRTGHDEDVPVAGLANVDEGHRRRVLEHDVGGRLTRDDAADEAGRHGYAMRSRLPAAPSAGPKTDIGPLSDRKNAGRLMRSAFPDALYSAACVNRR